MGKVSLTIEARAFGPVWLAGRETRVALGKTAARFVKAFRTDGSNAYLQKLPGRVSPEGDIILWMGGYDPLTKTFTEIPGVLCPWEARWAKALPSANCRDARWASQT